ncbi:MAG TPA: gluconate 2-dehydrogenase subunit 3 family protein [Chloroflexota bacterium]|jgi:hypothetical protein
MTLEPSVAGPQAAPAVTPQPTAAAVPAVLDDAQRALLRSALNRIVPTHGSLAGAGDLDVGSSIERTLAESPRLRRLFLDGLVQIAVTSDRLTASEFVTLDDARQVSVLRVVEESSQAFFTALVEHAYRGYYTLRAVQRTIGMRPPQPLGYELPPFDPTILDQQRQRSPFWRKTN